MQKHVRCLMMNIEESNEYKRKVIRYASVQSENAIEETVVK